jgi:hypothetical protein
MVYILDDLPTMRRAKLEHSKTALLAHDKSLCAGSVCPLHRRTKHFMRKWPQSWRDDRGMMERICPCGVGHPDPDHLTVVRELKGGKAAQTESVHGCCGCCRKEGKKCQPD